ncbi:hypothetical protein MKQ70_17230 [Chitinophaga sedimenti]|uniref:hypothetical protein n=1 Tax=Chitinophaga sedimenti TaxID=2033606 RepID=UPI0020034A60|nr:hypothetical protein [Chitinophaga sedimenti]MCK7556666.1 hypothetical protein [Chitinophaga sedimenti]
MKQFINRLFLPGQISVLLITLTGSSFMAPTAAKAQQTKIYTDEEKVFKDAQQLFREEKYAVSMQLFKQTIDHIDYWHETNRTLVNTDAHYYFTMCALRLGQADGEKYALRFLEMFNSAPREQMVSFELARYYFQKNKLKEAIPFTKPPASTT